MFHFRNIAVLAAVYKQPPIYLRSNSSRWSLDDDEQHLEVAGLGPSGEITLCT
jgi:hypothetical protein